MAPILIAVVAAAASYGAAAALTGAVIAGITIGATAALAIGSIVGAVVAYGLSMLLTPSAKKPVGATAQDNKQMIRSSIQARRVIYGEMRVSGPIVYAASSGADQGVLHLVIPLAGHAVDSITTVWLNDIPIAPSDMSGGSVVSGPFAGKVVIGKYDGTQTTADPTLVAQSPDGWSAAHKLLGIAYLYVRLEYDKDLFQGGIPNVSALVKGKKVYDPRSSTTAWSDNWALCIRDYLTADYGLACTAGEYDDASIVAAANIADELVSLDADDITNQKRYRLNGTFTLDEKPIDIMDGMLAAGAGALTYVAGAYYLYAGSYIAPSATLTESDFAGAVELQTMPGRAELFNSVKGTYIEPNKFWQASEFPSVKDSDAIAADGEAIWREVDLKFVTDATQAQRLALQGLRRNRAPLIIKAPLRYASLALTVWQSVAITLPDFGWTAKPFRITGWNFSPADGTCSAVMQEEQVAAYAWIYDDAASALDVPNTTLIDPLAIPAPTGLTITATTALQGDGATVPALAVTWSAVGHAFVTAYEVQWQEGAGPWNSQEVAAPSLRLLVWPVISGGTYTVRVRAVAGLARSAWSTSSTGTGAPDTTAPGVPTSMLVSGIQRGFYIAWTNPVDADLDLVEVWQADFVGDTYRKVAESRSNWAQIAGFAPGDVRYFALKTVDRSGNAGTLTYAGYATVPRLLTDDIQASSITGAATVRINNTVSANAPGSGYAYASIGGVTVTLEGDGRAMIFAKFPHTYRNPAGPAGGTE